MPLCNILEMKDKKSVNVGKDVTQLYHSFTTCWCVLKLERAIEEVWIWVCNSETLLCSCSQNWLVSER